MEIIELQEIKNGVWGIPKPQNKSVIFSFMASLFSFIFSFLKWSIIFGSVIVSFYCLGPFAFFLILFLFVIL